jgi:hypothetical protein
MRPIGPAGHPGLVLTRCLCGAVPGKVGELQRPARFDRHRPSVSVALTTPASGPPPQAGTRSSSGAQLPDHRTSAVPARFEVECVPRGRHAIPSRPCRRIDSRTALVATTHLFYRPTCRTCARSPTRPARARCADRRVPDCGCVHRRDGDGLRRVRRWLPHGSAEDRGTPSLCVRSSSRKAPPGTGWFAPRPLLLHAQEPVLADDAGWRRGPGRSPTAAGLGPEVCPGRHRQHPGAAGRTGPTHPGAMREAGVKTPPATATCVAGS